jgi:tetratricopeptide (TPR) repeat protein
VARRGAGNVNPEQREEREGDGRRDGGGKKGSPARRGTSANRPEPRRQDRGERQERRERREPPEPSPPPPWEPEQWIEEPDAPPVRTAASKAVSRGAKGAGKNVRTRRKAPTDVSQEIGKAVGRGMSAKVEQRLMDAARAFERERYREADRILKPLVDQAPDVPAVRELYGVNLYRLGRWNPAAKELELFRKQTGSVEQNPVLADSYRALGRHTKADRLWDELRAADAPGELVTEGRIVAAGSLADRGRLADGIRLLEKGPVKVKKPKAHHLRLWYALGDLYERAGDTPKARALFERVAAAEPDFADAAERAATLG